MIRGSGARCWRKAITDTPERRGENDKAQQARIVSWLRRTDSHGGRKVTHIETHISHVFLAGETAWKLKKAIKTPFLDYSSPKKRRLAALKELEVNRRTAADLYLGLRAVVKKGAGFAFAPEDGEDAAGAVDWLVHMRRFDQADLFDRMLKAERLTATHVAGLADALGDLHKRAAITWNEGGAAGMAWHYQAPFRTLDSLEDSPFSVEATKALKQRIEQGWHRLYPILEARRRHGYVRYGHGDLHLANACLFKGRPTLFDAIEFSDRIACTDCLYDMAFAVMDFLNFGRSDYAALFISRYLEMTRDYKGLTLMPFYIAIRALVRAMAHALIPDGQDRAFRYFALAEDAISVRHKPVCLALGGLSGTGKSTLARAVGVSMGPLFGAVHIRSDGIRKRMHKVTPETLLDESAYNKKTTQQTYERLLKDVRHALLGNWPVVVDATFMDKTMRDRLADMADKLDVPFRGLWLHAPPDILRRRLSARPKGTSDADLAILERQLVNKVACEDWTKVDVSGTVASALSGVRSAMKPANF